MKNYRSVLLSASIALALIACTSKEDVQKSVNENVELTLNDGEKWDVPNEMMVYMDSAFYLIANTENSETSATQIAKDLERYKNGFVSSCSMQGDGHDVLHSWLVPYMELLDQLAKVDSEEEKERIMRDLAEAKSLFEKYFE